MQSIEPADTFAKYMTRSGSSQTSSLYDKYKCAPKGIRELYRNLGVGVQLIIYFITGTGSTVGSGSAKLSKKLFRTTVGFLTRTSKEASSGGRKSLILDIGLKCGKDTSIRRYP